MNKLPYFIFTLLWLGGCATPSNSINPLSEIRSRTIPFISVKNATLFETMAKIQEAWALQTGNPLPVNWVDSENYFQPERITLELTDVTFFRIFDFLEQLTRYRFIVTNTEIQLQMYTPGDRLNFMMIQAGSEAGILLGIPSNATPRTVVAAFEARGVDMRHVEVERFGADSFFLIGHSKQEGWLAQSIWQLAERGFGVLPAPKTPSRSLP